MYERRDILTVEGLGIALRERRQAADLSQQDAAAMARTTRATISAAERGQGGLSARILLDLLRVYGCALRVGPVSRNPEHDAMLAESVSPTPLVPPCPAIRTR